MKKEKIYNQFKEEVEKDYNLTQGERLEKLYQKAKELDLINCEDYKFNTLYTFGASDYASLVVAGFDGNTLKTVALEMATENDYKAYVLSKSQEVPKFFEKVADFKSWVKFYDDESLINTFKSENIEVYLNDDEVLIKLF